MGVQDDPEEHQSSSITALQVPKLLGLRNGSQPINIVSEVLKTAIGAETFTDCKFLAKRFQLF